MTSFTLLLSQLSHPDKLIISKPDIVLQELYEYYRRAEQQGALTVIFSANLVAIPLLCALKNIQAKKYF